MSTRLAKQIVYAAFYLFLWGFVVWAAVIILVHPAPSCFDNIQNQNETGVDCGGVCAKVCAGSAQAMKILSVNAFTASAGHDTFLAKIANPNNDYAADNFDYSFNAYDAAGKILQSFTGNSFLYGNEVKYLLLPNQLVPSGIAGVDLTIANADWVKSSIYGAVPQFAVQNVVTQMSSSSIIAAGQVINNDVSIFKNILIVSIFKDSQGNPLGTSQTVLDVINPNQTRAFSVTYPMTPGVDPSMTEVVSYAARQ